MSQAVAQKRKIFDSRYEILSIVGRGSKSVVYHAITTSEPAEHIALKVLTNKAGDNSATEQLRKEALAMVASRHKYTVRLDDFHSLGQISYLAMEYAHQGDLRKYMHARPELLPIPQIERFMLQIAEALAFMHSAGILHRDIKPDNILVVNDRQSRLADFGVAILPGEPANIEELQKGVGTMDYMAPEVLEGIESTKRSDIYLFGVTFYEVLTGVQPFANIPLIEVIERRKSEHITPPRILRDEMPQYLEDIIMRAIDFDPAKRFESAEELLRTLQKQQPQSGVASSAPEMQASSTSAVDDDEEMDLDKLLDELAKDLETEHPSADMLADIETEPTSVHPEELYSKFAEQKQTGGKRKRRRKRLKSPSQLRSQADSTTPQSPESKSIEDFLSPATTEEEQPISSVTTASTELEQPATTPVTSEPSSTQVTDEDDYYGSPSEDSSGGSAVSALFGQPHVEQSETKSVPIHSDRSTDIEERLAARTQQRKDYQDLYRERDHKKSSGIFRFVLITVIAIWLLDLGLKQWTHKGITAHISEMGSVTASQPTFPVVAQGPIEFPALPAGIYHGAISGLITKDPLPLVITRATDSDELVFSVGLPGWKPAAVQLEGIKNDRLIVRSGGFILALRGAAQDQVISGTFENSISGEEGTWSVTPMQ